MLKMWGRGDSCQTPYYKVMARMPLQRARVYRQAQEGTLCHSGHTRENSLLSDASLSSAGCGPADFTTSIYDSRATRPAVSRDLIRARLTHTHYSRTGHESGTDNRQRRDRHTFIDRGPPAPRPRPGRSVRPRPRPTYVRALDRQVD